MPRSQDGKNDDPLSWMTRLSHNTYFYQPSTFQHKDPTVIICSWMNAAPVHIAFYLHKYRTLAPRARLILLRGYASDILCLPRQRLRRALIPALDALRYTESSPVYLHIFSNSGAYSASCLLEAVAGCDLRLPWWYLYPCGARQKSANRRIDLSLQRVLIDSAPSLSDYTTIMAGLSYVISAWPTILRLPGLVFAHFYACFVILMRRFYVPIDRLTCSYNDLLDPTLIPEETPRIYFYSGADKLVRREHIEAHAAKAQSRGFPVTMEEFVDTAHCRHAKGAGEERYWKIVHGALSSPLIPKSHF